MIIKQKIWDIQEFNKEKAGCFAAELDISPLVTGILLERGFQDAQQMREFLYGSERPFHDPYLLKDMERTAERIAKALADGEQITVYGDYDVDGITASSLLYIYLKRRGAFVSTYIPKRKSEGYGLNDEALKTLAQQGTTLLVTVDCGISGLHEVENAPAGMDIIITDHHTVPELLPPAYAIVNPKQQDCHYPFKDLSGVGVAFKLCQALEKQRGAAYDSFTELTELAALGTVADIVPMLGENRELVRRGLAAMEQTGLQGLAALIRASGCPQQNITSEHIGFILAPRLNAVGRLEHAQRAVELLVTDDADKAEAIAQELNQENALRQEISRRIQEEAEALLVRQEHIETAIVLASEGWHQGVIGIVASRLVDKYHLPTILFSISDGVAKGSCRSIPALNLYEAIAAESDILTQFGGHHQAAGLTLPETKLAEFKERFTQYVRQALRLEDYLPHQTVDCLIGSCGRLTVRDLEELSLLEPCGCSNQSPVFAFRKALLHGARAIGKDHSHLQFFVDKGDYSYKAVMWHKAELLPALYDNMIADIAFMPKKNCWNGETSVQLHAADIRLERALYDLRGSGGDKERQLAQVLQTGGRVLVLAAAGGSLQRRYAEEEKLRQSFTLAPMDSLAELEKILGTDAWETAVLYDIPSVSLKKLLALCRQHGCGSAALFYGRGDYDEAVSRVWSLYPDRERLAAAYRQLMCCLQSGGSTEEPRLLHQSGGVLTPAALAVFAELGFIKRTDGWVELGEVRRTELSCSASYNAWQEERGRLLAAYRDAMQLTQYELQRG